MEYQSTLSPEQKKQLINMYMEFEESEKAKQKMFVSKLLEPNNKYQVCEGNGYELYPCLLEIVSFDFNNGDDFYFKVIKSSLTKKYSNEVIVEHHVETQHCFKLSEIDYYQTINEYQYENISGLILAYKEVINNTLNQFGNYFKSFFKKNKS